MNAPLPTGRLAQPLRDDRLASVTKLLALASKFSAGAALAAEDGDLIALNFALTYPLAPLGPHKRGKLWPAAIASLRRRPTFRPRQG
jgi:hypothetical protein